MFYIITLYNLLAAILQISLSLIQLEDFKVFLRLLCNSKEVDFNNFESQYSFLHFMGNMPFLSSNHINIRIYNFIIIYCVSNTSECGLCDNFFKGIIFNTNNLFVTEIVTRKTKQKRYLISYSA